ncbi:MAG: hypothetical protein JNK05_30515 [Myxococcales bacterium]|nr:hypothetical protein [Myxococcales bacterium]
MPPALRAASPARPAIVARSAPPPNAAFEAWLASRVEKSVHLATPDGRCEHMTVSLRTGPGVEGWIAPYMTQTGVALFSFYFEYAEGRLTLRDPQVARYAGSAPHASLASCEHSIVLTSANAEAFSWSDGRWYRTAAACEAAVARRDPGVVRYGSCDPLLDRVRSLAAQPDVLSAPSPLLAVARANRSVFRLSRADSAASDASSAPATECVEWSFRPDARSGAHGALRTNWASDDGARGYTEFVYELGANTIMLLGPRTEVTRRPRVGGIGTVSFGCEQTKFVDVAANGVVTAAGEPWFLSRRACETARAATPSPAQNAGVATANRPRSNHDC